MFTFGYIIGSYSYLLFFFGLFGLLYPQIIFWISLCFFLTVIFWKRKDIGHFKKQVALIPKKTHNVKKGKLFILLSSLFLIEAVVNLIGALGPETAFDALWYHLTLPKLYLMHHSIYFIPGGLLYYSAMPKLGEILFIPALAFGNEITVKLIQFVFGLLIAIVLFKLSRKYFSPLISVIAVLIFYTNIVVAWESTTAYIDLIRTFFELLAFYAFTNWWEKKKKIWLIQSSIFLGFAVATKVLALGSLVIFLVLIAYRFWSDKKIGKEYVFSSGLFSLLTFLVPLPWFIFSYVNTGNPVYPFFTKIYEVGGSSTLLNPLHFFTETWNMFVYSADPISPLYIIFLPWIILFFTKWKTELKVIVLYSILAIVVWYFTPRTGGGRFILPYLPVLSLLVATCIAQFNQQTTTHKCYIFSIILLTIVTVSTIGYRAAANKKYLPVIVGKETKQEFLSTHLNFSYGDFYDTDGYFQKHIQSSDTVLLYGFHNLYYVDFPFIDSSWVKKGDRFNYIAVQHGNLPQRFHTWKKMYENPQTMVQLYSSGGNTWVY